jgi:hypothetical protein
MSPLEPIAPDDAIVLQSEHRDVDALLGEFIQAAWSGALADAVDAIARLDDAVRVHMSAEEQLFPPAPAKLAATAGESEPEAFFRELRLEHVQIRELSGMIRRVLGESADLSAAQNLAAGLAKRWEAHTKREEEEWMRV